MQNVLHVADHIPLKQGLRLNSIFFRFYFLFVADHIPLKQGLRPLLQLQNNHCFTAVADHIPLKQGLRQT